MCSNVRFVHTVSFLWLLLLLLLWASVIAPAYYVAIIGFQMPDNVFFSIQFFVPAMQSHIIVVVFAMLLHTKKRGHLRHREDHRMNT